MEGVIKMEGLSLILLILAAIFYFIPVVIASKRDTQHFGTIFFINFVFGWTVLGWVAALIWAIVEKPKEPVVPKTEPSPIDW
jgi:hypothetical protein